MGKGENKDVRLKEYRVASHITQKELADAVGVTQAYISTLENGKRKNPSIALVARIANVLKIDIRKLISMEGTV